MIIIEKRRSEAKQRKEIIYHTAHGGAKDLTVCCVCVQMFSLAVNDLTLLLHIMRNWDVKAFMTPIAQNITR